MSIRESALLRMLRHTPEKGSPDLRRTRRMSPTLARSGFEGEKRRVRAPVGSRREIWSEVILAMGSGQCLRAEGGGGATAIFLRPSSKPGKG